MTVPEAQIGPFDESRRIASKALGASDALRVVLVPRRVSGEACGGLAAKPARLARYNRHNRRRQHAGDSADGRARRRGFGGCCYVLFCSVLSCPLLTGRLRTRCGQAHPVRTLSAVGRKKWPDFAPRCARAADNMRTSSPCPQLGRNFWPKFDRMCARDADRCGQIARFRPVSRRCGPIGRRHWPG